MRLLRFLGIVFALACAGELSAQSICWDCESVYYPGDDCWIDSCQWTNGAGSLNCSQSGGCGDLHTCLASGPGCEGSLAKSLLDGRPQLPFSVKSVTAFLAEAEERTFPGISLVADGAGLYLTLSCSGARVGALYADSEVKRIRAVTQRLSL